MRCNEQHDGYYDYICHVDLEFGEWVGQADGSKLRDIKYTLSLNYSFGPKFSPSTEHQVRRALIMDI